jgi:uncharacterized protein YecE (DUF72 family)
MGETFIGAGGWAYFNVPHLSPLKAYSQAFNYVEVNSTFYEIPPLREVDGWRRSVPEAFHFTVRAHMSITHGLPFEGSELVHDSFKKMLEICRTLRAEVLHFQLPPSTMPNEALNEAIANFLDSADVGKLLLAMEFRREVPLKSHPNLLRLMQERGIIHSVDLLKGQEPAYGAETLYARLFGKGYHNLYQPTDDELKPMDDFASGFSRAYLTFHGARMYSDAARMKSYKKTGNFPRITKAIGVDSLREVLAEDARFPATKGELLRDQGWKLFDSNGNRRIRVGEVLERLQESTYDSIEDVLQDVMDRGDAHER